MGSNEQFRPVKHAGVTYKPRGDGGMLVFYDHVSVRIFVNGPDELPWASERTKEKPAWTRTRGASALHLMEMRQKADAYLERHKPTPAALNTYITKPALAYAAFLQHIHPAHFDEVNRVALRAFNYYSAIRRCPGLFDVACSGNRAPGLAGGTAIAYALSNVAQLVQPPRSRPLDLVRRLVKRKRRDIVIALGFPTATANIAVRALERIDRRDINVTTLELLRELLRSDDALTIKRIAHLNQFTDAVLQTLSDQTLRPALTLQLLDQMADRTRLVASLVDEFRTLQDTVAMLTQRGAPIPRMRSMREVDEIHNAEINRRPRDMSSSHTGPFPPAPVRSLPGHIEYIDSAVGLADEGHTMHNCVGSYADRVARHECFIYRVLEPERCTLAIELGADMRFHVRELKAQSNHLPSSPATRARIEQWLSANHDPAAAWPQREPEADPMLYGDAHAIPF